MNKVLPQTARVVDSVKGEGSSSASIYRRSSSSHWYWRRPNQLIGSLGAGSQGGEGGEMFCAQVAEQQKRLNTLVETQIKMFYIGGKQGPR